MSVTLFFMGKGHQMLIPFCEQAFPTIMAGINKSVWNWLFLFEQNRMTFKWTCLIILQTFHLLHLRGPAHDGLFLPCVFLLYEQWLIISNEQRSLWYDNNCNITCHKYDRLLTSHYYSCYAWKAASAGHKHTSVFVFNTLLGIKHRHKVIGFVSKVVSHNLLFKNWQKAWAKL